MKTKIIILTFILTIFSCQKKQEETQKMTTTENPLLQEWITEFGVPPFDSIKNEHYLPALEKGITEQKSNIEQIIANKEEPTFQNTIEAIERSGKTLNKVSRVFFAVNAAHTNDVLKSVSKKIAPKLSSNSDDIYLNKALFEKVKTIYSKKEALDLSPEQVQLLEETYKSFIRSGANLQDDKQKRLREINTELASLSQAFGEHLLNETNAFELYVENEKDLGNLPANLKGVAEEEAKKRRHEKGWSFTLHRPSINPFLQASPNRVLRKTLFDGYANRANNNNQDDNKSTIQKMVSLRVERAQLLGYETHADYILSNNMAKNPQAVYAFMDKIWPKVLDIAKKERDALAKRMKEDGIDATFEGSDWRHYVEKVREERYQFNEEETRPYFELNAVRNGAFALANKLFGLTFKDRSDLPKWHPTQQVYEVLEANGKHLGILYMDFYARESKKGGAWMNSLRSQSKIDGEVTPIVTNNFNYAMPTKDEPTLLSFTEAETVFHEFGHALHGLFSNVQYTSLSGTSVPRDFVEFPSQVMENWMSEPEVLKLFAKHYKTGEVIPDSLIEKMNRANRFNDGFATVEYMAAAYLDMAWHTLKDTTSQDVNAFEKNEMNRLGLIEEIIPRYRSTYFQHIFSGGYSSGYYSYLWSQVLDADAFQAFKETSIFDQETAKRYRTMLSKGGSEEGMKLYTDFRGREPKIEPLLKKKGVLK